MVILDINANYIDRVQLKPNNISIELLSYFIFFILRHFLVSANKYGNLLYVLKQSIIESKRGLNPELFDLKLPALPSELQCFCKTLRLVDKRVDKHIELWFYMELVQFYKSAKIYIFRPNWIGLPLILFIRLN